MESATACRKRQDLHGESSLGHLRRVKLRVKHSAGHKDSPAGLRVFLHRAILLRFVRRGLLRCGVCHAAIWRVMSLRPPMDVMRDRDATYVIGYESSDDF